METIINFKATISNWLQTLDLNVIAIDYLENIIFTVLILLLAFLTDFFTKKIILSILNKVVKKSKTNWDDILLERKVFNRLSHLAPAIVIYYLIPYVFDNEASSLINIIQTATSVYMDIVFMLVAFAFITALGDIYDKTSKNKKVSIKSYLQVAKIIIGFIGALIIFSILFDKDLSGIFTGLGAFAAVLLLIFQDSIKGLVGGITLSANDMVRMGDWISMPKYNADGTVIDISLNTVKVQNWDKTISTIPTYSMVTESFSNWRGMEESGGRRIKRSLNIDIKTIKFCDQKMIDKYNKIQLLKNYIEKRRLEIEEYNKTKAIDEAEKHINSRVITNIGTFRMYLENYLKNLEVINKNMTFIVRQLPPTEMGLPMEIYVFSKVQEWAEYEEIQSDIFDHIYSILDVFELAAFQNPSGNDFKSLMK
jgi:miniconductance mechanosensitive channel